MNSIQNINIKYKLLYQDIETNNKKRTNINKRGSYYKNCLRKECHQITNKPWYFTKIRIYIISGG
jgi:hypothetical protein